MKPVAVLGPTASGKSALALAVAAELNATGTVAELVSVDAMQVYRGMDIGTAKPTAAERALVVHHGLDLVDPSEEFTVAEFQRRVRDSVDDIERRGGVAILVGGTGLYLRAVIDDLGIPGQWPDLRAELERRAATELPVLFAELTALDPVAAQRMEPTNQRRIVRALEVCLGSGETYSSFGPGLDSYPESRFGQLGLRWPRQRLTERIEARIHAMLDAGFLEEVRRLRDGGPLSRTARQAIGYGELLDHLDGRCTLSEAVERFVLRTRQFAVRQDRWFRRDPRIRWVDVVNDPVAEGRPVLLDELSR